MTTTTTTAGQTRQARADAARLAKMANRNALHRSALKAAAGRTAGK